MEAFELYLLKSAVWLTGFGLIYLLFLRNERYFLLNRVYLVSGLLASILFPLLNWNYTIVIPVSPSPTTFGPHLQTIAVAEPLVSVRQIIQFLYISGIIYLIFQIIKQTVSVLGVIRKSGTQPFKSVKLIRTTEYPVSFSFFSFVFVNLSINDTETNEIVNHEQEHVRQKHWIDLILYELLCTLQWFNPMSWLYGRFIRQNHEYLADERALQHSSNPALYRAALLNQMFGGPVISLAHSFNYSLNTKRFNMMKNKIYSPIRKLKLLLVLPLVAAVFYVFATPEYTYLDSLPKGSFVTVNNSNDTKAVQDTIRISPESSAKGGKTNTITVIVDDKDVKTDKSTVTLIKKKGIKMNVAGYSSKQNIVCKRDSFAFGHPIIKVIENELHPLIVKDGVIFANLNMKNIPPDDIASIRVWKGENATKKFGYLGINGVVEINMKQGKSFATDHIKVGHRLFTGNANSLIVVKPERFGVNGIDKHPLIVKDGVIAEEQNVKAYVPDSIESVSVFRGKSATDKYGQKGKDGVIEITSKKKQ